jgi:hypothetical protein
MADHFRCALCGKLSLLANFRRGEEGGGHKLEVMKQESLSRPGSKGGFVWSSRTLMPDERDAIVRDLRAVTTRVTTELMHDDLARARSKSDLAARAAQHRDDARAEYEARVTAIDAAADDQRRRDEQKEEARG